MNCTKRCTKCQGEFPATLEFFHKCSQKRDNLRPECKKCCKARKKQYYENNKDKIKERSKQQYLKNRDAIIERKKKYYELNRDAKREYQKQYAELNRDAIRESQKQYHELNRDAIRDRKREYTINKYHSDPHFKIKMNLSRRMRRFFSKNGSRTIDFIGCSIDDLKLHLEKQFVDGMSWENYGDWHVDHIRPCCSFDLTDPEQQRECFNYTNLQPLWAEHNLSKGGSFHE